MSDSEPEIIQPRRNLRKLKPKIQLQEDDSIEKKAPQTPKNQVQEQNIEIKNNSEGIVTQKVQTKQVNKTKQSGTLFDYFKAKREIKDIVIDQLNPVRKQVEIEQVNDVSSEELLEELEPITSSKLPNNIDGLRSLLKTINSKIKQEESNFLKEQYELSTKSQKAIPNESIPICGNVIEFDFDALAQIQMKQGGKLFDVIMMDPPWQLASAQPSRGVAIQYKQLSDEQIKAMPVEKLQNEGFIFVWAINAKYSFACSLIEKWGYKIVDEITWVKKTVNGKVAPSHGFYLQHAKESCIVGVKGNVDNICRKSIKCDVIVSKRRGQSQKPEEIYQLVEELVPNGFYLEIFGRRNNLRDKWVTLGNEL